LDRDVRGKNRLVLLDEKVLKEQTVSQEQQPSPQIVVSENGPYLVSGNLPLNEQWIVTNAQGESLDYREGESYPAPPEYALCRCGQSSNKPFCDGSHEKVRFDGTETASRQPYLDQVEVFEGPTMLLADAEGLCAFARFCDPKGRIWNLVYQTDDPEARRLVEYESGHCPGGRLVAFDRETGESVEPEYEPSLGLIEDTARRVSGPIWVRGAIPVVSANGTSYEVRNQIALCRCGRSDNKPFCNGSHAA
jgi:CDGSH-type Zn-finger protein